MGRKGVVMRKVSSCLRGFAPNRLIRGTSHRRLTEFLRVAFAVLVLSSLVQGTNPSLAQAKTAMASTLPPYPQALPRTMFIGLGNATDARQLKPGIDWMMDSKIPWD